MGQGTKGMPGIPDACRIVSASGSRGYLPEADRRPFRDHGTFNRNGHVQSNATIEVNMCVDQFQT